MQNNQLKSDSHHEEIWRSWLFCVGLALPSVVSTNLSAIYHVYIETANSSVQS